MTRGPLARQALVAGVVFAGILGGHTIDYLLLVRGGAHRASVLHLTGHGYMPRALTAATAWAALAAIATAVRGYRSGTARAQPRLGPCAARLALVQSGCFVALEVTERLVSGAPLSHASPFLALGIAVQVVLAVAGAALLRAAEHAGELVARAVRARRRPSARPPHLRIAHHAAPPPRLLLAGSRSSRGPPGAPALV